MKGKWYRSNIVKTILLALEHVCLALMVVSMLCVCAFPQIAEEVAEGKKSKTYENSLAFEEKLERYSWQILEGVSSQELFTTNGTYNPDKLVDIKEFYEKYTVSGKNKSGLAFRLGDMLGNTDYSDEYNSVDDQIVVCQKIDESYQYYTYGEFSSMISEKQLEIDGFRRYKEDNGNDSRVLDYLSDHDSEYDIVVRDENGNELYENCWLYAGYYYEGVPKPDGADSILDLVNHNKKWNGHLNEIYNMYGECASYLESEWESYENTDSGITEGNTNLSYLYINPKTKQVISNIAKYNEYSSAEKYMDELKNLGRYVVVRSTLAGFETNLPKSNASYWKGLVENISADNADATFIIAVDTDYPVQDEFYVGALNYKENVAVVRPMIYVGVLGAIVFVLGFIWLTITAGRKDSDEELHMIRFDHWKTEIAAILFLGVGLGIAAIGMMIVGECGVFSYEYFSTNSVGMVLLCACGVALVEVAAFAVLLSGYLSLVRRIKAGTLWKNSVLKKFLTLCGYLFENLHSLWKILIIYGVFVAILLLLAMVMFVGGGDFLAFLFMLLVLFAGAVGLIIYAIGREKIVQGITRIAGGDLDYKIPTEKMIPDQKAIAEKVNRIGEGLDAAVEKSMKSERMKTDLITNVSHDIKTPLTSIINYVDLLKKEDFKDPKIQRYLEVLEQKSQRLKVLTEDVVEASKVSSGNISLEFMRINLVEMIQQTSGEFGEKFEKRGLTEILTLPEEEVIIHVDGRRTWRVLENIYNNAAKYAMTGSRVYAELRAENGEAVFTLKNISEQPLNISADELTERFIRGDVSRSTEGSGLGLSIAQNLTQLQGGKFNIYLDGDLFKVTIRFPMV